MPVFFFDFDTPEGFERADVGVPFASIEAAFLSAHQAAVEMIVELLRNGRDAGGRRFEVRDERGSVVLELPFLEVLHPRGSAGPRAATATPQPRQDALARSREDGAR